MPTNPRRVLLSSVSSDAHTWNLVWLQQLLVEYGHRVDNLGACVPDRLLVSRAVETRPEVIALSTVNGHGLHDGLRVIEALRAVEVLRETLVVIGGKLGVAGPLSAPEEQRLRDAGFDAVFGHGTSPAEFIAFIERASVPGMTANHLS